MLNKYRQVTHTHIHIYKKTTQNTIFSKSIVHSTSLTNSPVSPLDMSSVSSASMLPVTPLELLGAPPPPPPPAEDHPAVRSLQLMYGSDSDDEDQDAVEQQQQLL